MQYRFLGVCAIDFTLVVLNGTFQCNRFLKIFVNTKTGYFLLYNGLKHGEALLCSHKDCQARGVKFVYCCVCDLPAAIANFTTRHSHPEVKRKYPRGQKPEYETGSSTSSHGSHGSSPSSPSSFYNDRKKVDIRMTRLRTMGLILAQVLIATMITMVLQVQVGVAATIQIPQRHLDTAMLLLPNSDNNGSSINESSINESSSIGSNNIFCSSSNNNDNLKLLLLLKCLHRLTNLGTVT